MELAMIDVTSAYAIPLVWPRRALDLAIVDGIAIHHTVTLYLSVHATEQDERNQVSMIHTYHKTRGWGGFAYHIISFPSGRVYLVVPLTQLGTHVGWQNDHLLGIVVAGNFTSIVPGKLQQEGVVEGIRLIHTALGREVVIKPHRAWTATTCPGNTHSLWVPGLTTLVKEDDMKTLQELEALIVKLREDATNGDTGIRVDLTKLRRDTTGADNDMRARLDALEAGSIPSSPEGIAAKLKIVAK